MSGESKYLTDAMRQTILDCPWITSVERCKKCEGTGETQPDVQCKRCEGTGIEDHQDLCEKPAMTPSETPIEKTAQEISECCRKQKELCDNTPHYKGWQFAPHDGVCYACNKNIYQNYGQRKGYTGESYITGCCHCNRSYCD